MFLKKTEKTLDRWIHMLTTAVRGAPPRHQLASSLRTRVHQPFPIRPMQHVQTSEDVKRFSDGLCKPSIVCPFCRDSVHMCSTILLCVASRWVTAESRAGLCST